MSEFDANSKRSDLPLRNVRSRYKYGLAALVCLAIVCAFATFRLRKDAINLPESVSQAASAEAQRDFIELFHRKPDEADLLMTLAQTAVRNKQPELAIDCFARIPSDHIRYGTNARFQEAEVLLRANRVEQAEASFREFLTLQDRQQGRNRKDVRKARAWLVFMMTIELRFEERKVILQQMIQDGEFDVYDAKQFYFPSLAANYSPQSSSRLRDFLEQDQTSRPLLIAHARYLVKEGKLHTADQLLQSLRLQKPEDPEAIAVTLECLYEMVDWKRFGSVIADAPEFRPEEPWLLTQMRAEFAKYSGDLATAENYYRKVLESDPANPACHMGLAAALYDLNKTQERTEVQERAVILAKIRVYLSAVNHNSPGGSRALARDSASVGMFDAAQCFKLLADRIERGVR